VCFVIPAQAGTKISSVSEAIFGGGYKKDISENYTPHWLSSFAAPACAGVTKYPSRGE
jgi:hypothetical protein